MATLRVGDPLDKNTDVGAINSRAQLEKIDGARRGGHAPRAPRSTSRRAACPRRATGSRRPSSRTSRRATGSRRRRSSARCSRVLTFRTPEEAVEKANNTPYGLSAGVWTEKGSRILWMAERLRAGVVWANTFNRFDPASPFGGYKESGLRARGRPARARAVPRLRQGNGDRGPARRELRRGGARGDRPGDLVAGSRARRRRRATGWTFFDERTRPEDVLVAVDDGEVAGYVRLAPVDAARVERATCCR